MPDEESDRLFPDDASSAVIAELSVWTSVDDCLAAARSIEGRPRPGDTPSNQLILPYGDDDAYEALCIHCLGWFMKGFRAPSSKIRLAALLDREAAPETWATLLNARFAPNVQAGPAGAIGAFAPPLAASHRDQRFLVVVDSPHVIELVQSPVRCLLEVIGRTWSTATQHHDIRKDSMRKTGGAPTVFHQPYTDGPLFALIEALAFYLRGLTIGPNAQPYVSGINRGYRSIEVVGRPPLEGKVFGVAQQMAMMMFQSIA